MSTQQQLEDSFEQIEDQCRKVREQREAQRRRHVAHLEIEDRMKHSSKPAKTKRFGIGALRRNHRLKSVKRAERFDGRSMTEFVPIRHVPASREETPSGEHVTSINHGGLTSLWPLTELARVNDVGGVFDCFKRNEVHGNLPMLSSEELVELSEHLNTGFRVFSA